MQTADIITCAQILCIVLAIGTIVLENHYGKLAKEEQGLTSGKATHRANLCGNICKALFIVVGMLLLIPLGRSP